MTTIKLPWTEEISDTILELSPTILFAFIGTLFLILAISSNELGVLIVTIMFYSMAFAFAWATGVINIEFKHKEPKNIGDNTCS